MDYTRYLKGLTKFNSARLALWAAMLAIVAVAGIAALARGPY